MAIVWKNGDVISADKLNNMQLIYSTTDVKTNDATDLPDGAVTLDLNGDLYQAASGKQTLLGSFKGPQGDKGDKGDTGDAGAAGPAGPKGDTGAAGQDGLSVKSGTINEDNNGAVTGATLKMSDDSTINLTLNKATA